MVKHRHLVAILIVMSIASLFVGVIRFTPMDLFGLTDQKAQILMISRLPRLLSVLLAGMSMSICGLLMQQLTQNKFVSPTTAGTLDCTRLGILLSLLLFAGDSLFVKILFAFVFALIGTYVFTRVIEQIRLNDTTFVPLAGIAFGGVVGSLSTFIAYRYDLIQNTASWLMGDFSMMIKGRYELLYINIPLLVVCYLFANQFTIAGMGEALARNLGLNYRRTVQIGLAVVAMTTAAVVLTVGTIPFLGLVVPNIVSIMRGDHLRNNLGFTALLGSIFLLGCDLFGRLIIYPYEIPISLTVGVVGSALFIYLLVRNQAYAR